MREGVTLMELVECRGTTLSLLSSGFPVVAKAISIVQVDAVRWVTSHSSTGVGELTIAVRKENRGRRIGAITIQISVPISRNFAKS